MNKYYLCPSCQHKTAVVFLNLYEMPVHQNLIYPTEKAARNTRKGDIALAFCHTCGFIFNAAFDLSRLNYDESYDNAQGYSDTFQQYMQDTAQSLVAEFALHQKRIVEIGCGRGDFINMLCTIGNNTGLGFDPAYQPNPDNPTHEKVKFVQDFYTANYKHEAADFFCSRHVIEHIPAIYDFISLLREAAADNPQAGIYFETPDVTWILKHGAFWDIFYEHCSLFSPGSIARAFVAHGFHINAVDKAFGEQYMHLKGKVTSTNTVASAPDTIDTPMELYPLVQHFAAVYQQKSAELRNHLMSLPQGRIIIWGAAGKGSTLLNSLQIGTETIPVAIDINPKKQGNYIGGTAQRIISPQELPYFLPHTIIITNSNYETEIKETAAKLSLFPDWIIL